MGHSVRLIHARAGGGGGSSTYKQMVQTKGGTHSPRILSAAAAKIRECNTHSIIFYYMYSSELQYCTEESVYTHEN